MRKSIQSSDQTHSLYHTLYRPKQTAKAALLVVHGMAEHSGRYDKFAQYLADNDIAVLTYDLLGHGRSIRNAEELGYFNKHYPMQTLLKDVIVMTDTLKKHYPDVPQFIMGHSMGSFIVRNVLQTHSSEFAGAILMGTSDYDPLTKVLLPTVKLLNKLQSTRRNHVFAQLTNKLLNLKLNDKTSSAKFAWVVKDENARQAYEDDPLTGFDFTNNGFLGLFELMNNGLAKDWAQTIEPDFAMLFVSGKDDPVGNMGKGINKLTKRLTKQGFTQIDKQLYAGMRHEPLHEQDNKKVYQNILVWINNLASAEALK